MQPESSRSSLSDSIQPPLSDGPGAVSAQPNPPVSAVTHQSAASENAASVGARVEDALSELDELLVTDAPDLEDPAFPEWAGAERRSDSRHPFLAEVIAVLLKHEASEDSSDANDDVTASQFKLVRGRTLNLSPGGVCFVLPERLDAEELLLLIRHPDFAYPRCCFTARPFRVEQDGDGHWEYGALLRPMTGPVADMGIPGF